MADERNGPATAADLEGAERSGSPRDPADTPAGDPGDGAARDRLDDVARDPLDDPAQDVDPATFRSVLRHFATGVTVVTTWAAPERPWGTTANSFSSVSLRPPLVLVAFERNRRIVPALRATARYAVNMLGEEDQPLSDCFAGAAVEPDRNAFCGAPWHPGETGLPLLDAGIASLECTIVDVHPAGDHDLYIARVDVARSLGEHQLPLLYYCGRYLRIERATQLDLEGKPER